MSSPQVSHQTQQPHLTVPGTSPEVGLLLETLTVEEGASTLAKIKRRTITTGECSVDWRIDAPAGLLSTPAAGKATFLNGVTEVAFSIGTNFQTGTQGDRALQITLDNNLGCMITPGQGTGAIIVRDRATVVTGWWQAARRSERLSSGGVAYEFGADTPEQKQKFDKYELDVALVDGAIGWTVLPDSGAAVVLPYVTVAADFFDAYVGEGTVDLDVKLNDKSSSQAKIERVVAVSPLPQANLAIVGTSPLQKVRFTKTGLLARKYNFSYRLMLENDSGVFGDANAELELINAAAVSSELPGDYAKTTRDVILPFSANLGRDFMDLYNSSTNFPPGSRMIIPAGDYNPPVASAGFTLGRTTGISASQPLVIYMKDENWATAKFFSRLKLTAPHHTVVGVEVKTRGTASGSLPDRSAMVELTSKSRVSRCKVWHLGTDGLAAILVGGRGGDGAIVDRCDISVPKGGQSDTSDGRGLGIESTGVPSRGVTFALNYIHDMDQNKFNFHEAIQLGRGHASAELTPVMGAKVIANRMDNCTNDGEGFSIKSDGNLLKWNMLKGSGNSARFTMRLGNDNEWIANLSQDSNGFNDRGARSLYHSNVIEGSGNGTFSLDTGSILGSDYIQGAPNYGGHAADKTFPASWLATCYYNKGTLEIGAGDKPCDVIGTTVRAHDGTVTAYSGRQSGTDSKPNDPAPLSAGPRVPIWRLGLNDVGLNAPQNPVVPT